MREGSGKQTPDEENRTPVVERFDANGGDTVLVLRFDVDAGEHGGTAAGEPLAVTVVECEGELVLYTSPWFRDRVYRILEARRARSVVLDLAALRTLDSVGLSMLLSVKTKASAAGVELALAGLGGQPLRLFHGGGFEALFVTAGDVEAAKRRLLQGPPPR